MDLEKSDAQHEVPQTGLNDQTNHKLKLDDMPVLGVKVDDSEFMDH